MDTLQCLSVDVEVACSFASSVCRSKPRFHKIKNDLEDTAGLIAALTGKRPTFMELFGQGRVVEMSNSHRRDLNIHGLGALDLRTNRPDGVPWDFNRSEDRILARQIVETQKPTWVKGSPPCRAFSRLDVNLK